MSAPLDVTERAVLSREELVEVHALADAAEAADDVDPLDDQVRSELVNGAGPDSVHLLLRRSGSGRLAAYAHLTQLADGASAHLVVDPEQRRIGVGGAALDVLLGMLTGGDPLLRIWAHGDTPGAQALATSRGFARVRDLWQMRAPLTDEPAEPAYPADVTVRTFEPGRDDEAWVALNAIAFAHHPEQGRLTVDDLHHRMAESWFDPAGLFLAERLGQLIGSHWTKVHPTGGTDGGPIGEVYAIGIHPDAQGMGLGRALTLTGLRYLRDRGLDSVMLYVDGDNVSATRLYRWLGFEVSGVDAMYAGRP